MPHISNRRLNPSHVINYFRDVLSSAVHGIKRPYIVTDFITLALLPPVYIIFLLYTDEVGDKLVGFVCVAYLALRSRCKIGLVVSLTGFSATPILYFFVSIGLAENVARYTFYILLTAMTAELISLQRPKTTGRRRVVKVTNETPNSPSKDGKLNLPNNHTSSDVSTTPLQALKKTAPAQQQPIQTPAKQKVQQHPQAKPPTKRKLIQG